MRPQVLAVAGSQEHGDGGDSKELWMVQFYDWAGDHLRTLRMPGSDLQGLSWEGSGLRLALAVDSFIYFANVRPDYKYAYICDTLVYAFNRPDRLETCVMFWNTKLNERYPKYVKSLMGVQGTGDYCVLASKVSRERGEADGRAACHVPPPIPLFAGRMRGERDGWTHSLACLRPGILCVCRFQKARR